MTLTVTVLMPAFAACATDRRLTAGRKVVSEQARKLIQLDTGSFQGLLAYNGVGRALNGETPNDWVSEAQAQGSAGLEVFCARLKTVSEPRLRRLSPYLAGNPRHTFVLAGFDRGIPVMGLVSNYEFVDGPDSAQALEEMKVGLLTPRSEAPFGLLITGATDIVRKRSQETLLQALRKGASRAEILSKMKKIIRDTSYVDRLKGSVGSSVQTSLFDPTAGFTGGGDAVGGSSYIEMPDAYLQGVQYRDIWISTSPQEGSRYNPRKGRFDFAELPCRNCGNPVPEGQRRCGSCDHPVN